MFAPEDPGGGRFAALARLGPPAPGQRDAVGSGCSLVFERLLVASWDALVRVLGCKIGDHAVL